MGLKKSFGYAWRGIKVAFREERNLRIHFGVAALVVLAGIYFRIALIEWIALAIMIGLVVSLELVNSAIESLTDRVGKEWHPLAEKTKDVSAGAVLFASIVSVVVGLLIFVKYILNALQ